MTAYVLKDWLELHSATAEDLIPVLSELPRQDECTALLGDLPDPPPIDVMWRLAAEALVTYFPSMQDSIKRTLAQTSIQVDERLPRPFTFPLKNQKRIIVGLPHASCSDALLWLAHEFGHSLQFVASKGAALPPVLREVAAFLSERVFSTHIMRLHPNWYAYLRRAERVASSAYLGTDRVVLLNSLKSGQGVYEYSWNYPLAWKVAADLFEHGSRRKMEATLCGCASLAEILPLRRLQNENS